MVSIFISLLANGNINLGALGKQSKGCLCDKKEILIPNSQLKVQRIPTWNDDSDKQ